MISIKPKILLSDISISNGKEACSSCSCICPCDLKIVKNVHPLEIINPLNQIKKIKNIYFGKVPKI